MLKKTLSSILCLGALAASVPAAASALYGVGFNGPTPLYSVDTSTGAVATIGPTGGSDIGDLTSDTRAASFRLWGVDLTENLLHTFDTGSGAISSTVAISLEDRITSIAFDTVSGKLYGNTTVGFGAAFDALYEIDPNTGVTTFIGRILFSNVFALGFDQAGQLFGISDTTDELISISTASGNGALVGGVATGSSFDIASRPEDGQMFLADSSTFSLYRLDTATGATSLVGAYGSGINVVGLAFGPGGTVPLPGTLALSALGLVALGARAGRRAATPRPAP